MTKVPSSAQIAIGNRLKDIRIKYFSPSGDMFSISRFAEKINENGYNIANYESGKAGIPNAVLAKICYLGFNLNWLITGTGEPFTQDLKDIQAAAASSPIEEEENDNDVISAVKVCAGDIASIISRKINEKR